MGGSYPSQRPLALSCPRFPSKLFHYDPHSLIILDTEIAVNHHKGFLLDTGPTTEQIILWTYGGAVDRFLLSQSKLRKSSKSCVASVEAYNTVLDTEILYKFIKIATAIEQMYK